MAEPRRRALSQRWVDALRSVMPKAPFTLDQLEVASGAKRNLLRAQAHALCVSGHLTRQPDGRYDLTPLGIEKIMADTLSTDTKDGGGAHG